MRKIMVPVEVPVPVLVPVPIPDSRFQIPDSEFIFSTCPPMFLTMLKESYNIMQYNTNTIYEYGLCDILTKTKILTRQ